MKNLKYVYTHTMNYDLITPNGNFDDETCHIVTDGDYNFADWLYDNGVTYDYYEGYDMFFVVDNVGKRTGEAFQIVSITPTNESITGSN